MEHTLIERIEKQDIATIALEQLNVLNEHIAKHISISSSELAPELIPLYQAKAQTLQALAILCITQVETQTVAVLTSAYSQKKK